jgi:hypothetical protein
MVQSGGKGLLPKKFPQLQYPHLGLVAYHHHECESSYKYYNSFAILTFYIIVFVIEVHNLQVHK